MKMANEKLTVKKLLLLVIALAILIPVAYGILLAIILLTYQLIGFYSVILGLSIIMAPLLLETAYTLKKRRTKK